MGDWFVYILECADGSYYTGITCDLVRRVEKHKAGRGAKYTRIKGVKDLLWCMTCGNRSIASRHEARIKALSRSDKKKLMENADKLPSYT